MFHSSLLESQYMPSSNMQLPSCRNFLQTIQILVCIKERNSGKVIIFTAKSLPGSCIIIALSSH